MKKILKTFACLTLVAAILACGVSCGNSNKNTDSGENTDVNTNAGENADGALNLLNTIWNSYKNEEKFPASGGDEANLNFEGPGKFAIDSAEELDSVLGLPASLAGKIDSAASLSHAMNANTFTCGAFHFKTESDAKSAVSAIKSNILSRHWICGFPDSMLIISVPGNYVIAVWGIDENTDVVTTFKNKVTSAVNGAEVAVSEPIV